MTYDSALRQVGEFGRYQKRIYLLLCLPIATCGMQVMVTVFILGVPRHRSVSISAPPSIGGAINLCIWRGGEWTIFQLYEFIAFHVYKEISDNVYLKINLDFMHTHLYLNFHLVYIHICKEENVSVCGACISVVKKACIFCLQ